MIIRAISNNGKPIVHSAYLVYLVQEGFDGAESINALGRNIQALARQYRLVFPAALGRYLAVADEQFFIAGSADEAEAWVRSNHHDDPGPIIFTYCPPAQVVEPDHCVEAR